MTSRALSNRTSKISKYVNINMSMNDTLMRCDPDNIKNFGGALMLIFDIDPEVIYQLANRDFYVIPYIDSDDGINYIQWITQKPNDLDPIEAIISYLYRERDSFIYESYEFDRHEIELRKIHMEKVENQYGGLENYLSTVSERLWKNPNYLKDNYMRVIESEAQNDMYGISNTDSD